MNTTMIELACLGLGFPEATGNRQQATGTARRRVRNEGARPRSKGLAQQSESVFAWQKLLCEEALLRA